MKRITALAALLLAVTVACGKQTENTENAPAAQAPAATTAPAPETAPANPATPTTEEDGDQIVAGEALTIEGEEQDAPITQRANTQLAQVIAPSAPAAQSRWQQGQHYQLLVPAQPTNVSPDKVEVVEMFWYGCSHCYSLEPFLQKWNKEKAAYVQFTRVPVTWSAGHKAHAQLYYTLSALGKGEELHDAVFEEIQRKNNMMFANDAEQTENLQAAFAKRHGINEQEFRSAYRSMGVMTRMRRAEELARRYKVSGVPYMIVNGKYTADVGSAGGQDQLIALINDLAAREQKKQ